MTRYRCLMMVTIALGATCAAIGGCSNDDECPPDAAADGAPEGGDAAAVIDAADATAAGVTGDPQVLDVLLTANAAEVQAGQLALSRAVTTEVHAFGQTMVTDHTAAAQREQGFASDAGIVAEPSSVSQEVQSVANALMAQLQSLSGIAFDRAYITSQVQVHSQLLTLIDKVLVPAATSAAMRAELAAVRVGVAAHLARAEGIDTLLRADGGTPRDGGP